MTTILSDWAGCTALAGENNYSRSPLTGSYPGSSKKKGVNTFELQGICNRKKSTFRENLVSTPLNCKGYATAVLLCMWQDPVSTPLN